VRRATCPITPISEGYCRVRSRERRCPPAPCTRSDGPIELYPTMESPNVTVRRSSRHRHGQRLRIPGGVIADAAGPIISSERRPSFPGSPACWRPLARPKSWSSTRPTPTRPKTKSSANGRPIRWLHTSSRDRSRGAAASRCCVGKQTYSPFLNPEFDRMLQKRGSPSCTSRTAYRLPCSTHIGRRVPAGLRLFSHRCYAGIH
jgi:hypothetical protein